MKSNGADCTITFLGAKNMTKGKSKSINKRVVRAREYHKLIMDNYDTLATREKMQGRVMRRNWGCGGCL